MELNHLTVITQLSRRALQEGVHIAYMEALERDRLASLEPAEDERLGLCRRCEATDIISHLRGQELHEPKLELSLGTLHSIFSETNCAFCDFVKKMIRSQYERLIDKSFWEHCRVNGDLVECVLEELWVPSKAYPTLSSDLLRFAFYIRLEPHPYRSILHHDKKKILNATFHTMGTTTDLEEKTCQARKIPNRIDPHIIKCWLAMCEIRHPYLPHHVPGLRVIDLVEERLVTHNQSIRYVTLSYTWGKVQSLTLTKTNLEALHTFGGLGAHTKGLSRTVQDAMTLTQMIGERFLWVDALCITQDDNLEKQTQIQKMDTIYQNSILTLVALHGVAAGRGLAGVNAESRFPVQHMADVHGQRLISHDVEKWWREAENSIWNTRGWTYQERLCSNRLLFIGKSQFHFRCTGNCVFCEEMTSEADSLNQSPSTVTPPPMTNYFPRAIWTTLTNSFNSYATIVSEYSKRTLSNPYDILYAAAGILNRWQAFYKHSGTICGLPVGMMDAALMWRCKGAHKRRRDPKTNRSVGYPSWSWAGWEGEFEYLRSSKPHDTLMSAVQWDFDAERYETNVTQRHKELFQECLVVTSESSSWKRIIDVQPIMEALSINYADPEDRPEGVRFSFPSRRVAEAATVYGALGTGGVLRFHTKCGFFVVTNKDIEPLSPKTEAGDKACMLKVLDKDGCSAGGVQIPSQWVDTVSKEPQELIVLSRTTLTQDVDDPSWDETTQTFLLEEPSDREQVRYDGKTTKRLLDHLDGAEEPDSYQGSWRLFDQRKYSALKFWPLYNVLLIQRQGDYVYRLGLGQIHVDAFDPIAEEKLILLH